MTDIKPWTVKGMTPESRNAAVAAAGRQNMTIGEWLTRAILAQVREDHNQERLPAVQPILTPPVAGADASALAPILPPTGGLTLDLAALERLTDIACKVSGVEVPKTIRGSVNSLVRGGLRDLRAARRPSQGSPGPVPEQTSLPAPPPEAL